MDPVLAARAVAYCLDKNTKVYLQQAYCLLDELGSNGHWPDRAEDCLRSYRCHCGYCRAHRTVTKELRGSVESAWRALSPRIDYRFRRNLRVAQGTRYAYPKDIRAILDGQTDGV